MNKSFTPLLPARPPAPATPATAPAASAPPAQPAIAVKRDGDRITHIIVTCACGQVIELACESA